MRQSPMTVVYSGMQRQRSLSRCVGLQSAGRIHPLMIRHHIYIPARPALFLPYGIRHHIYTGASSAFSPINILSAPTRRVQRFFPLTIYYPFLLGASSAFFPINILSAPSRRVQRPFFAIFGFITVQTARPAPVYRQNIEFFFPRKNVPIG